MAFVKEPVAALEKNKEANAKAQADRDATISPEEEEDMKKSPFKYVFKNPVNRYVLLGSFVRNVGGSVSTYFLPVFFLRNFPAFKAQYSLVNSINMAVGGMLSGIIAGLIADKYEKKTSMIKAYICMFGCTLALPLLGTATLQTGNFWLSMLCVFLYTLTSGAFSGSAITMM